MNLPLPTVLVVGRTNVGKSALFNRLVGEKISLVFDRPGVTRDWIEHTVTWDKQEFLLVDSGGLEKKTEMSDKIRALVHKQLERAAVIIFVVDATTGVLDQDADIARILHKLGKPVILVANKADSGAQDGQLYTFRSLGFGDNCIAVSALHGRGTGILLDKTVELLAEKASDSDQENDGAVKCKISIVGKPNTGKSSLLNTILGRERSIVSDVAGTTREAIRERIQWGDSALEIVDTAGVRRSRSIDDPLEELMVKSSMSAIRQAHLIILVLDVSQKKISNQECQILSYVVDRKKSCIIALNKTDITTRPEIDEFMREFRAEHPRLAKIFPFVEISAKTGQGIDRLLRMADEVWTRTMAKLGDELVLTTLVESLAAHPIYKQKVALKVLRAAQIDVPGPRFDIRVSRPELFDDAALLCLDNILRSKFDLQGCTISFNITNKRPGLYKS